MWLRSLLVVLVLVFPALSGAYRQGEPENFSKKLVRAALERTLRSYPGRCNGSGVAEGRHVRAARIGDTSLLRYQLSRQ